MPRRTFTSPVDANVQFTGWLTVKKARARAPEGTRSVDSIEANRVADNPGLAITPVVRARERVGLCQDFYVRLSNNA